MQPRFGPAVYTANHFGRHAVNHVAVPTPFPPTKNTPTSCPNLGVMPLCNGHTIYDWVQQYTIIMSGRKVNLSVFNLRVKTDVYMCRKECRARPLSLIRGIRHVSKVFSFSSVAQQGSLGPLQMGLFFSAHPCTTTGISADPPGTHWQSTSCAISLDSREASACLARISRRIL